ncbi:ABC transporter permease [Cyanobacterium aponinum AL20118]|uniref:Transport permease protein n=3 Tax=Cyanobacterium aponinum TaxID=379064 RepID=K9Z2N7_CYAAP|nr:ABC transporter permease [Cyanobacterium aponinum]AFZ53466.1 ABC-2 type transporter [Cyanobacterium aponinum PCC 10605]MBD2393335.1 ABC transporter permease [Cyanobacterium aponinum FACHB-4101]MTF38530.1 ABC transporter permease [Cyanobacterium aponinum 0216]PHV61084.1 ABC transporter permease [Cyanobacterium aponinum IPPAS B-1201]WPF89852.1 ABC transporter permease [Cyanobacterium aponinum AL20115]
MKLYEQTIAIFQRILQELLKRKRNLIFWSVFPLTILVLNSYIIAERAKIDVSLAMKISAPPSLMGAALFFSCLGGTIATIVGEREQKTLIRLFISPLMGIAYFLGILLAHSAIAFCQAILIYGLLFLLGKPIEGSFFLGLIIIILSIISYVGVGFIFGTQLAKRTEDVNSIVATFGVPLLILGGTFFPSSLFPEKMKQLAQFNPIFHMNEALIQIWGKGALFSDIKIHFWFLFVFSFIVILLGWWCYEKMLKSETVL